MDVIQLKNNGRRAGEKVSVQSPGTEMLNAMKHHMAQMLGRGA